MAKTRPASVKGAKKSNAKSSTNGSTSRPKSKGSVRKAPPATQQKTKRPSLKPNKKNQREYTDQELGIPKLNMITPAGVQKPKGKKKGKVFIDDQESMMTLLAMVNAEKEGQIESKVMKARQFEEIREARQREMDARQEEKKAKIEETKNSLRRKRKDKDVQPESNTTKYAGMNGPPKLSKKRVSFD